MFRVFVAIVLIGLATQLAACTGSLRLGGMTHPFVTLFG
jgi:hypothetical protein